MTAASLFSGIGAPEVAMPAWRWLWHAEIEPFPAAVMAKRHPTSINLGDVTAHDFLDRARALGRPDVIVFGSPCQSYSIAGQRLGLDDPRGNLALVALALIERLAPAWFVFENVPGLFSSWSGGPGDLGDVGARLRDGETVDRDFHESSDFAAFLSAVRDIGRGGAWRVLDAQYFRLAQRRRRLFFVGCPAPTWQRAAAVLLEPESLCGHPPARSAARQDLTDGVAGSLGARRTRSHTELDGHGAYVPVAVSGAVSAKWAKGTGGPSGDEAYNLVVTHSLRADGFDASEDGTGRGTPLVPVDFDARQSDVIQYGDMAGPLDTHGNSIGVAFQSSQSGVRLAETHATLDANNGSRRHNGVLAFQPGNLTRGAGSDPSGDVFPTLKADIGRGTSDQDPHIQSALGVRRLMPDECERLQGFRRNYTLIRYRGKRARDGPRYKAVGNSMAVPVIRWILQRLAFVHELRES